MTSSLLAFPRLSLRFVSVWRRNALVWRKLAIASVIGNLADPMIFTLALGYGMGGLLPAIEGVSYIAFLAAGTVCLSTMNSASFESLYSAFSRMHAQRTWDAILNAPIALEDLVLGEMAWAASKAVLSGGAILIVIWVLGLSKTAAGLWVIPLLPLIGLAFAGLGLIVTALASGFDFFTYYMTLVLTPMAFLSGVFFPADQLPAVFQTIVQVLPLSHAIALTRPLLLGYPLADALLHVAVLAAYTVIGFYVALVLLRRRLAR